MTKKRVVLFKKSDTLDSYNESLLEHGYAPQFIPVLDHISTNIDAIRDILLAGPQSFHALILTSQRSVQAMSEAYNTITNTEHIRDQWDAVPVYIVGPHTAKKLSEFALFNDPSYWTVAPRALELIPLVIRDQLPSATLLFLAGDKRRDLIPTQLKAAHFNLVEVQSYATCMHPLLPLRMEEWQTPPAWCVLFSPSGLKFLLDCIKHPDVLSATSIAAIGPTTAEYIQERLHISPHVIAAEPDAYHLTEAMLHYDQKNK